MDWNDRLVRSRRVAARTIGEETYIVSPWDSMLHRLPNDVASRIWMLADGRHTLRQIHRQILDDYDVDPADAERDLLGFAEELVSKGLAGVESGGAA